MPANSILQDYQARPTLKLNSINLEDLHSSRSKLSLEPLAKLEETQPNSIYHTTIPIYFIIITTLLTTTALICRKRILKRRTINNQNNTMEERDSTETYAEIKTDNRNPGATPSNISALFSTKVSK